MIWKSKKKEKELLEKMFRLYEQKMYTAAFSVLHSREQAEDVVQDSFIKIVPYLKSIDTPDSTRTKGLIMQIVRTTAIDQYRKNHRESERTEAELNLLKEKGKGKDYVKGAEDRIMLRKLLEGIPEDYREIIRLRCYYGFSVNETAEILKLSPDCVSKKLERARKLIKDKIEWEEAEYERKKSRPNLKAVGGRNRNSTV